MRPDRPIFLFAFANDPSYRLRLEEEERVVRETLGDLDRRKEIEYKTIGQASLDDIYNAFNRYNNQIYIFHYGGHSDSNFLHLSNSAANAEKLAILIGQQKNLKLAFFNGCSNRSQVEYLFAMGVPTVIATRTKVDDTVSRKLAEQFYLALSGGKSIRNAFETAVSYVQQFKPEIDISYRGVILDVPDNNEFPWGLYAVNNDALDWHIGKEDHREETKILWKLDFAREFDSALNTYKRQLEIIDNKIAKYQLSVDIPVSLIGERKLLLSKISTLEILSRSVNEHENLIVEIERLIESLESISNVLVNFDTETKEVIVLQEMIAKLEDELESLMNAPESFELRNHNDLNLLVRKAKREVVKNQKKITYLSNIPASSARAIDKLERPLVFVNRKAISEKIEKNIHEFTIFVIVGFGGIGKTTLVSEVVNSLKNFKALLIECKPDLTIGHFFYAIAKQVPEKEESVLSILKSHGILNELIISTIIELFDEENFLIVIDDFHKANEEFELIVDFFDKYLKKGKLFLVTRRKNRLFKDVNFRGLVCELECLDVDYIQEYLGKYKLNVDAELAHQIHQFCSGHPFALRLFCTLCMYYSPIELIERHKNKYDSDLRTELIADISEELSPSEIKLLNIFSMFNHPINREFLNIVTPGENDHVLNRLLDSFLIVEPVKYEYEIHDLFKEFFYERIEDKEKTHIHLANIYRNEMEPTSRQSILESYYHYYKGKDYDRASKVIEGVIKELINESQYDFVYRILEELESVGKSSNKLIVYKAVILEARGNWEECLKLLVPVIEKTKGEDQEIFLNAINIVYQIYDQKGDYQEGLSLYYDEHEKYIDNRKKTPEMAHLYHRIGRFYNMIGDYDEMMNYWDKSLEVSRSIGDMANMGRTIRLKGVGSWQFGYYDRARTFLNEALEINLKGNHLRELADTKKHLGIVEMREENFKEAERNLSESIRICEDLKYKHGLAWAQHNLSALYIFQDKPALAIPILEKSIKNFIELGERNGEMENTLLLAKMYFLQNEPEKALEYIEKGIAKAEQMKVLYAKADFLELQGEIFFSQGELEESISAFENALRLFIEIKSGRAAIVEQVIKEKKSLLP